jgi:hypothetical protein
VAENQPINKHRMNLELFSFAARLRALIDQHQSLPEGQSLHDKFDSLALELFALQFKHISVYKKISEARQLTPATVRYWAQVPFVPTSAFKELELSSIPPEERTAVFHSSGTTEQKPSRHFHCPESLAVYEASLWKWFKPHFSDENEFIFLTPDQNVAPHSSLVHMFETVRKNRGRSGFFGNVSSDGAWAIDFNAVIQRLKSACDQGKPLTILGTAFSFVHLLDFLAEKTLSFNLPQNSQVMETGGYKNRSRTMPKGELHALITKHLGVPDGNIVCEYGMSELSSQAYDHELERRSPTRLASKSQQGAGSETGAPLAGRCFRFPPWARVQIISPETGHEVAEGETGLIRIFDLANVFSVAAIQTEDLGIRRDEGFELIGRAQLSEPRGCSLMTA